jgi:beta-N-acetylhexosaminidase
MLISYKIRRNIWFPLIAAAGVALIWWVKGHSKTFDFDEKLVQAYEFTVWGDSLEQNNSGAIRVVQLSELEAVRASMLILQNEDSLLPIRQIHHKNFQLITVGSRLPYLRNYLNLYSKVSHKHLSTVRGLARNAAEEADIVIVGLNQGDLNPQSLANEIRELKKDHQVIIVNFGNPDVLLNTARSTTSLQVPSSQSAAQMIAAQVVFGGIPVYRGTPDDLKAKLGLKKDYYVDKIRLGYVEPERTGLSSDSLRKIDAIVAEAISAYAFPGCQVMVAHKGYVVHNKSYGYHTYRRKKPVKNNDLYDLASITKVAATTLGTMKLYEEGQIQLDKQLGDYFKDASFIPTRVHEYDTMRLEDYEEIIRIQEEDTTIEFSGNPDTLHFADSLVLVGKWLRGRGEKQEYSPVFDIPLSRVLTHSSGLPSTLPVHFYQRNINSPMYSRVSQNSEAVPVAENLFLKQNYLDSLWNETKSLRVDSPRYCYSCVNMVLMQRLIDSVNQSRLPDFLQESFYGPLGMQTMSYNPRERFPDYRLIPTASDRWRGQLIHGTVHDPIAALMGGVSGNAGLFSNANDLAILGQMWLNEGSYGGQQFLSDTTLDLFTARQYGHRGFGFDKPPRNTNYIIGESASLESYGHTGFTGTCIWVDPEHELVFVFLSNRIYPSVSNTRINQLRVRQRIHQVVYDALDIPWRMPPDPERIFEPLPVFEFAEEVVFSP